MQARAGVWPSSVSVSFRKALAFLPFHHHKTLRHQDTNQRAPMRARMCDLVRRGVLVSWPRLPPPLRSLRERHRGVLVRVLVSIPRARKREVAPSHGVAPVLRCMSARAISARASERRLAARRISFLHQWARVRVRDCLPWCAIIGARRRLSTRHGVARGRRSSRTRRPAPGRGMARAVDKS